MKKRLWCVILATMLMTGVVGCSNSKPGTPVTEGTGKTEDAVGAEKSTEPDEEKTYEYTWTFYQTAPLDKNPIMKGYFEEKFNVKFDVWDIEATKADEILAQRIIGGDIPDKFQVPNPNTLEKYVNQRAVAEIPMEMLETYAPNILKRIMHDRPGALEYGKVDGKLYGLPTYSTAVARAPVAWRGDWLANVGIDKAPETLEEFETAIYKFTNEDPDGNGKNDTYGLSESALTAVYGAYGYIPYIKSQGASAPGNWTQRDGKLVYGAVQPEMKEALTLINKWYKDGVLDPEFVTGENQGGYWALSHAFINGRIGLSGMGQTYHWQPQFYADSKPGQNIEELEKLNKEAAENVVVGIPPAGPYGQGTWANPQIKAEKVVFGKQLEEEPDKFARLLQILDWVYETEENHTIATKGIEGTMWEYQERVALDGTVEQGISGIGDYKDGKVLNANFAHTALSYFSPLFEESTKEEPANIRWARSVGVDKYIYSTELLVALPSESQYKAELDKLVEEAYLQIITGHKPIDYFDEFVAQWKKLGGETLENEANEWYATIKK